MKHHELSTQFRRGKRRGFTLSEMTIAVAVFSMVMAAVLALQSISARTLKELHMPTISRSARMIAFNQIRYRLSDAAIGSCEVSGGNSRVRFHDPNQGAGVISEFYFEPPDESSTDKRHRNQGYLYYDKNIGSDPPARLVAVGPVIINFRLGREESPGVFVDTDALVTLYVKTADDLAYSRVDERDGETVVYLRNPATE